jgi:hypothetical protein
MAWIKYFDASPAFFMAVNGQMAFPNTAAAQESTRKFAQTIRHIELKWGDDLRVDRRSAHQRVRRGRGLMARDSRRYRRAQRYRNWILYRTCRVSRGTLAVPRRSLVVTRFLPVVSDGSATPRPAFAIEAANKLLTPGRGDFECNRDVCAPG